MVNKIDKVLTSVQFNGEGKIKSLKETILNSEWFCSYEECDRRWERFAVREYVFFFFLRY
jgi:hypothetical protein